MLLQTNSYIVPKDKRSEHARLVRKFRQTLHRLGCDHYEVYEQVGANWAGGDATGRFVQIMRFRDRKHQQQVQAAEKSDPPAQQLIAEFCALINFPYQQQQGLFAVGFYTSAMPVRSARKLVEPAGETTEPAGGPGAAPPAGGAAELGALGTAAPIAAATGPWSDEPPAPETLPLQLPSPDTVLAGGNGAPDLPVLDAEVLPATSVESAGATDAPPAALQTLDAHEETAVADVAERTTAADGAHVQLPPGTPEALLELVPEHEPDDDPLNGANDDGAAMLAELTFDDEPEPAEDPHRSDADARPRGR